MTRVAANPRVHGKVSGLYAATGDPADWTVDAIRPIFDHVLDVFGPDRLMYGGDWPVSLIAGGYTRVWSGIDELLGGLDAADRDLHPRGHRPLVLLTSRIGDHRMTELFTLARLGAAGHEVPVVRSGGRTARRAQRRGRLRRRVLRGRRHRPACATRSATLPEFDGDGQRVGAPIARPGKIVCIGLNYRDHAEETGAALPAEPVVFMKDPSTIVGPFDDVLIPRGSTKTDWEVELGVVIGTTARYLDSPDEALGHVAGYAVSHDVSEREFQLERGGQWDKGKSCETFNPFGPDLVPADAGRRPAATRAAALGQRRAAAGRHDRRTCSSRSRT